ncbi:MAG: molybdopterin converting factor subunit 1 [Sandaracinaceae bacterium]|nr:molybdopterin converting factor subunit 1 [Sandaracinaceae bacterium]
MSEVTVLYFAAVAELAGLREERFETDARDVEALARALEARHPRLAGRLGAVRFAVNETFARADDPLADGDVVAVIPPVAGGSDLAPAIERVAIGEAPLSIDRVCALVRHPGAGALAVFVGVVRDHSEGRAVEALEYSAYDAMARREMAVIVDELEAQIPGVRLAAHHRVGPLRVGDDAIVCAASSPHRDEAFRAGRALIDRIKERVPIWKRERSPGESRWVGWDDGAEPQKP